MQKRPDDLDAYQLALVGYDQLFSPDYTTFVTARTNFERAHVLNPTWAPRCPTGHLAHAARGARMVGERIERTRHGEGACRTSVAA